MENNALKHYRYGGKITHIGMEVLPNGNDITVTIASICYKENEMVNGKNQACWVAYFRQNQYLQLPMILNATNKKRLARLAKTPYLETVKNLPVILTKEMDRIPGENVKDWCLRISNTPANLPPAKTLEEAKTAIQNVTSRKEFNLVYTTYQEFSQNGEFLALCKEIAIKYPKNTENNENI